MGKTIEVSDETFEKIKSQLGMDEVVEMDSYKDMIGKKFFIRTVTYHLIGQVKKQVGKFLQLSGASGIGDSGRFMQAIKEGKLDEVEPVGDAFVNIDAITDFFPWRHKLPTEQK